MIVSLGRFKSKFSDDAVQAMFEKRGSLPQRAGPRGEDLSPVSVRVASLARGVALS
jgi:hypothetical protein